MSHADNGQHDGRIVGIGRYAPNEGHIDLQFINGKPAQIGQARITGAKIINRNGLKKCEGLIELRHDPSRSDNIFYYQKVI